MAFLNAALVVRFFSNNSSSSFFTSARFNRRVSRSPYFYNDNITVRCASQTHTRNETITNLFVFPLCRVQFALNIRLLLAQLLNFLVQLLCLFTKPQRLGSHLINGTFERLEGPNKKKRMRKRKRKIINNNKYYSYSNSRLDRLSTEISPTMRFSSASEREPLWMDA